MHRNTWRGTRETLHLAWRSMTRSARGTLRDTSVMDGCRESDRFIVPTKPSNKGCPMGLAEKVEGRERAKGNVVQHSRGRTQRRVSPVTGARLRMAGTFGCLCVMTRGRSPVR
jgi:hypothetical protein